MIENAPKQPAYSCIYNRICIVDKKETIYPLVHTVNTLYLQLLEMQKAFTSTDTTSGTFPASNEIREFIRYKECNFSVTFDDPNDVVYLYRQAKETPLLYAKLALKKSTIKNTIIVYHFSQPCPRNNFYQVNCI